MDLLEADLARAFPGCPVYRAFLSRRFPEADSPEQVLERLKAFDRILVQAMLVSPGPAYEQLLARCPGLPVGKPLLASPEACAEAIQNRFPKPLLLMGHGSSLSDLTGFAQMLPADICFAALEGQPSLDSILPQLAGRTLHLAPFLLTAGTHTERDLAAWQHRLEAAGCAVTLHQTPLAHCPEIRAILVRHLQAAAGSEAPPAISSAFP